MGWRIHPELGVREPTFTSLAFEFHWNGLLEAVVQGYGTTWREARDDAVVQANRWLKNQRTPHLLDWLLTAGYHPAARPLTEQD